MIPPPPHPAQGDIWDIDLDPAVGHEQRSGKGGSRPCLVLSVDRLNSRRWTVIVIPLTGNHRRLATWVPVPAGEAGLRLDSHVMCEQVRAVDMSRFAARLGAVERPTLVAVHDVMRSLIEV